MIHETDYLRSIQYSIIDERFIYFTTCRVYKKDNKNGVFALTFGQKRTSRVSSKPHFNIATSRALSSMLQDYKKEGRKTHKSKYILPKKKKKKNRFLNIIKSHGMHQYVT